MGVRLGQTLGPEGQAEQPASIREAMHRHRKEQ